MAEAISDDELFSFLDGELDEAARARVESSIAADASLKERLEKLQSLNTLVRMSQPNMSGDIDRFVQVVDKGFSKLGPSRSRPAPQSAWMRAAAIAVLVLGGASTGFIVGQANQEPQPFHLVEIAKGDPLYAAISDTRSGDEAKLSGNFSVKPILTFQTADGRYCREVELDHRERAAIAITCRSEESWRWIVLQESEGPRNPNGYATVGDYAAMEIEEVFAKLGGDTPLSLEDEGKLIASKWRLQEKR